MLTVKFAETGGPEVLKPVEVDEPQAGSGELLVDVIAAGVNFIDIYFRRGTYPAELPWVPGDEAVGVVRSVGPDVTEFSVGDRVAWTGGKAAYAEVAVAPVTWTTKLPASISDDAGFILAQGLAAHYLAHDLVPVSEATTALVHAAAGGVGQLLTRMLKIRGARVIATVSSQAKADVARAAGADEVIILDGGEFTARVRELTDGRGVDVVYDGVGKSTFRASLASIRPRGTLVLFGASSGPVEPVDPLDLTRAGSVTLMRPGLINFVATRDEFQRRVADLFRWLEDGSITVEIGRRFPLAQAAEAHAALESRGVSGKVILETKPAVSAG